MNREILFRGKTLDGMWLLGCGGFVDQTGRTVLAKIMPVNGITIINKPMVIEVEPETLSQYIGIKDKNGIRVFEGDILLFTRGGLVYVAWDDYSLGWIGKNETYGKLYRYSFSPATSNHVEVVGNIWDNPELVGIDCEVVR